jgi:hypothetical protein
MMATNHHHHDITIRKWIHYRFNEQGIEGIASKIHKHKSFKITSEIEKKIVEIATTRNPRDGYGGLPFSTWSLSSCRICIKGTKTSGLYKFHRNKKYPPKTQDKIWRQSKITLENSTDPE